MLHQFLLLPPQGIPGVLLALRVLELQRLEVTINQGAKNFFYPRGGQMLGQQSHATALLIGLQPKNACPNDQYPT